MAYPQVEGSIQEPIQTAMADADRLLDLAGSQPGGLDGPPQDVAKLPKFVGHGVDRL